MNIAKQLNFPFLFHIEILFAKSQIISIEILIRFFAKKIVEVNQRN